MENSLNDAITLHFSAVVPPVFPTWITPPSGGIIIFSPTDRNWLFANQVKQNLALSMIYAQLQKISADTDLTLVKSDLGILQEEVSTLTASLEKLLQSFIEPASLEIHINGRSPLIPMANVSDVKFTAHVVVKDLAGRTAVDTGTFTWNVLPAVAATTASDPANLADPEHVLVTVAQPDATGNQAEFDLSVSDGTLTGTLHCVPVAGGPVSLNIEVG